jgi:hypothetical protein
LFEFLIGLILIAAYAGCPLQMESRSDFASVRLTRESVASNAFQQESGSGGEIVLRDLRRIDGAKITGFDDLSVRLVDGTSIGWEEVLRADLKDERQSKFAENIASFGEPFYRLKHRLEIEDWIGAGKLAENLPTELQSNRSKYGAWINIALFEYYMTMGQRELAVAPWLRILSQPTHQTMLQELDDQFESEPTQFESGIANGLLPVFFDQALASKGLGTVHEESTPDPGWVYREALEICVGISTRKLGRGQLSASQRMPGADEWQSVFLAARESNGKTGTEYRDLLKGGVSEFSPPAYWTGRYWLARADQNSAENKANADLALEFLDVAANCESRFPELSAAALWEAIEILKSAGRTDESKKIEIELLRSFPGTYHGRALQSKSKGN